MMTANSSARDGMTYIDNLVGLLAGECAGVLKDASARLRMPAVRRHHDPIETIEDARSCQLPDLLLALAVRDNTEAVLGDRAQTRLDIRKQHPCVLVGLDIAREATISIRVAERRVDGLPDPCSCLFLKRQRADQELIEIAAVGRRPRDRKLVEREVARDILSKASDGLAICRRVIKERIVDVENYEHCIWLT